MPKQAPSGSKPGASGRRWVSVDAILATTPAPLARTRVFASMQAADDAGSNGDRSSCCCCCCCCCCCEPKQPEQPEPPPVRVITPTVALAAIWESMVDPTDLDAGVQALRGELRWRARGGLGLEVELEARTEGSDGSPQGRYPSWTAIAQGQAPVDVMTTMLERSMGAVIRLRAKASASDGTLGYSEVLTLRFAR